MSKKYEEALEVVKQIEEKLKAAKENAKKIQVADNKKQTKEQNKKDILYAIYRRTFHKEEYESDLKEGSGFDKFLTRDYERAYFGFKPIQEKAVKETSEPETEAVPTKPVSITPDEPVAEVETAPEEASETPKSEYNFEPRPGGGVYLDVPKDYKETAKALGAKWDRDVQKWFAPNGVEPEPIQHAVDKVRNKDLEK